MRSPLLAIDDIARICHEANRGYQAAVPTPGIPVADAWQDFPESQKAAVRSGVSKALAGETPEQLHQSWCGFKIADGWVYGEVKDADRKTHPCLVVYAELPESQKLKDYLFQGIVTALSTPASVSV